MKPVALAIPFLLLAALLLGRSGFLLPSVSASAGTAGGSEYVGVLRKHYFPPRELRTRSCGSVLLDVVCLYRDPTFRGSRPTEFDAKFRGQSSSPMRLQFLYINPQFSNPDFREIVIALDDGESILEVSPNEQTFLPERWSRPNFIGAYDGILYFSYEDEIDRPRGERPNFRLLVLFVGDMELRYEVPLAETADWEKLKSQITNRISFEEARLNMCSTGDFGSEKLKQLYGRGCNE